MNQDFLQFFPNQLTDGDLTECVALTVTDICGNLDHQLYDPDMLYADCLHLMNQRPSTAGLDPYSGFLTAVAYGLLPISLETFTAKVMGELYVANIQNYSPGQQSTALRWAKNGVRHFSSYGEIVSYLLMKQGGVGLAVIWSESFMNPNPDGTLPEPSGSTSNHMGAIYDSGPLGLLCKFWLGSSYGQNGYVWVSEKRFNQIFKQAFTIDQSAWRWLSLAQIGLTHPNTIKDVLPQMIHSS